ncbi:4835_t:CDS:1, partial [Acaulospora colombiana]
AATQKYSNHAPTSRIGAPSKAVSTMTFVQNSDINASTTPDLEERPSTLPKPFATITGQPQIGKPMLPPFAPVIFVEAKESSLSTELGADKYVPINVPAEEAEAK